MHPETNALLPSSTPSEIASSTLRKLDWRVLLLCSGVTFISYMDRGNLGFVAKDLCAVLDLNHKEYGLAVSLFYAGYICVQFISNEFLRRFGGPAWMASIMFAWGCVSVAMSLMQTATQFYVLRMLLGIAEGGTFPAVLFFLSTFYPGSYQTGAIGVVSGFVALAMPISSPLSAGLMALDGLFGVDGWRYVFVGEGLIPLAYSVALYAFLPRSPEEASFLEPEEKEWILSHRLTHPSSDSRPSMWAAFRQAVLNKTWVLASLAGMLTIGVFNVMTVWITMIIHDTLYGDDDADDDDSKTCGSKNGNATAAILLTAIPYSLACALCFGLHWYDNRIGIRNRPRFAARIFLAVALFLVSWLGTKAISFVTGFLSLVFAVGLQSLATSCNVAMITCLFDVEARSRTISLANIVLSIGALVFPPIVGALVDAYGYGAAVLFLGSLIGIAAILDMSITDPCPKQLGGDSSTEKEPQSNEALPAS